MSAHPTKGIIHIADAAKMLGVPPPTLRQRLKRLDAKMGGGLLIRFSGAPRGHYYADAATLGRLLPSLIRGEDPATEASKAVEEIRETVRYIQDDVRVIRSVVCEA